MQIASDKSAFSYSLDAVENAIEKACGFSSGRLTEYTNGRAIVNDQIIQQTIAGIEKISEELDLILNKTKNLTAEEVGQFSVYEFTFPNDKVYYGMSVNPELRWKNGQGYINQDVGKAIEEFGWENVEKRIIARNLTKKNAKLIESTLINSRKSNLPINGYNIYQGRNSLFFFIG